MVQLQKMRLLCAFLTRRCGCPAGGGSTPWGGGQACGAGVTQGPRAMVRSRPGSNRPEPATQPVGPKKCHEGCAGVQPQELESREKPRNDLSMKFMPSRSTVWCGFELLEGLKEKPLVLRPGPVCSVCTWEEENVTPAPSRLGREKPCSYATNPPPLSSRFGAKVSKVRRARDSTGPGAPP